MSLWQFVDKHMSWSVVFGLIAACLAYKTIVVVENYLIQRLNMRLRLGAKAAEVKEGRKP